METNIYKVTYDDSSLLKVTFDIIFENIVMEDIMPTAQYLI